MNVVSICSQIAMVRGLDALSYLIVRTRGMGLRYSWNKIARFKDEYGSWIILRPHRLISRGGDYCDSCRVALSGNNDHCSPSCKVNSRAASFLGRFRMR